MYKLQCKMSGKTFRTFDYAPTITDHHFIFDAVRYYRGEYELKAPD